MTFFFYFSIVASIVCLVLIYRIKNDKSNKLKFLEAHLETVLERDCYNTHLVSKQGKELYELKQMLVDFNAHETRFTHAMSYLSGDLSNQINWKQAEDSVCDISFEFSFTDAQIQTEFVDGIITAVSETMDSVMMKFRYDFKNRSQEKLDIIKKDFIEMYREMSSSKNSIFKKLNSDTDIKFTNITDMVYKLTYNTMNAKMQSMLTNLIFGQNRLNIPVKPPEMLLIICSNIAFYRICGCIQSYQKT